MRLQKKNDHLNSLFIGAGILILVSAVIIIFLGPKKTVFDEDYFYPNILDFIRNGISVSAIKDMRNQAPGPLIEFFFYFLHKLFSFYPSILVVRLFNFLLFVSGAFVFLLSFISYKEKRFWLTFFSVLSVPFIYPVFMLGLTESISMFFFSISFYFFAQFLKHKNNFLYLLFFAVSFSLAVIGRQSFLIVFPAFLFCNFYFTGLKRIYFFLILAIALIAPAILFVIWGGLVPPEQKYVSGSSIFSINMVNGLLGIGYFGIQYFILNINKTIQEFNRKTVFISFAFSLISQLIFKINFMPLKTLIQKISPDDNPILNNIFPIILMWIGYYFMVTLIGTIIRNYREKNQTELLKNIVYLFITLSPFKIVHSFSSLYASQACCLALDTEHPEKSGKSWLNVLILILGGIIGLHTSYSYFKI